MKRILVVGAVMTVITALIVAPAAAGGSSIGGKVTSTDLGSPAGGERTVNVNVRQASDGSWRGHVSAKVVIASNGAIISNVRGDVVCVEPVGDGWEIRYQITKASGGAPLPQGSYESLFVRDDPAGDQIDQVAITQGHPTVTNPDCGLDGQLGLIDHIVWETVIKGDIRVRI